MEKVLRRLLPDGKFPSLNEAQRRRMKAVQSKNTSVERRARMALVRHKIRGWILHPENLPARPDFYFPKIKLALFIDGCFWHGCRRCGHIPKVNRDFWCEKIRRNRARHSRDRRRLNAAGIVMIRVWEHEADHVKWISQVESRLGI